MKIAKKLFQTVCLAALFLSAGFLIYHMVYLPMENRKLVAELKGNFSEPEAPGASGSEKKDQPAGRKCPVAAVDLVSLQMCIRDRCRCDKRDCILLCRLRSGFLCNL